MIADDRRPSVISLGPLNINSRFSICVCGALQIDGSVGHNCGPNLCCSRGWTVPNDITRYDINIIVITCCDRVYDLTESGRVNVAVLDEGIDDGALVPPDLVS